MNRSLLAPTDNTAFIEDVAREGLASVLSIGSAAHGVDDATLALDLPGCDHFAVVLVDGLGRHNLHDRSGYARHLLQAEREHPHRPLSARLPTTTAASLTSLATGLAPGRHGIVGYSVYDRDAHVVRNQLTGWGPGMEPLTWQPHPTLFEQAKARGVDAFAIGPADYADSGFTRATLRGAEYVAADDIEDRFSALSDIRRHASRSLVQLYVPELDKIGHRSGWQTPKWSAMLERVDAAVAGADLVRDGRLTVLTGDHGMIDICHDDHTLLRDWAGVTEVAVVTGEPRCAHLVLADSSDRRDSALDAAVRISTVRLRDDLQRHLDEAAGVDEFVVLTRDELCDSGLMGRRVDAAARDRVGDLVVVGVGERSAIYLGDQGDAKSRLMVGQHGGFTARERGLPLLRW